VLVMFVAKLANTLVEGGARVMDETFFAAADAVWETRKTATRVTATRRVWRAVFILGLVGLLQERNMPRSFAGKSI